MTASAGLLLTTVVGLVWTAAAAPIHIVLSVIDECVPTPGVAGTLQPASRHALLTADLLLVSVSSLGYNDLGFRNNNEIDTPHLDALALGGIVLDRYCTPTSCCLWRSRPDRSD
jgi:hypothetical protein